MKTSDEELAKAAASGDAQAFSLLLERHYDRVFRVAFSILGSRAEAEDVTQDVCLDLPQKIAGFRAEAQFATWLHRIVVNAARDRLRRQVTRSKASDGWADWETARQAACRESAESARWLAQAMACLAPDLRETVALVLGEDMTHAAAGKALGVSEGTISWRMSEVKKALAALARDQEILK